MLNLLYNEKIEEYSNLINALFNLYNSYKIIIRYFNSPIIKQSLSISQVYFLFNLFIFVCMLLICILTICTMIQTFRESANMEIDPEDNGILKKISEIDESIEKLTKRKKENSLSNINDIKQIIWLGFEGATDLYNEKLYLISEEVKNNKSNEDNKMLLFTSSRQIISFFKYLFAIKPKMQFKNLEDKFIIVIECKGEENENNLTKFHLKEKELRQINDLFDWLSFAGCRIPVAVYSPERIDKNLRMIMINNFQNISFFNDKFDLNTFLKINLDESNTVSPNQRRRFSEIYNGIKKNINNNNLDKRNVKLEKNYKEQKSKTVVNNKEESPNYHSNDSKDNEPNNKNIKINNYVGIKEKERSNLIKKHTAFVSNSKSVNDDKKPFGHFNSKPILKNMENNSLFKLKKKSNNSDSESQNKLMIE